MLYCNKELYDQTCAIKKGEQQLSPCLEALRSEVSASLGIRIVSIVYDTIDIGPARGRPRLNLIVESSGDQKKICADHFDFKEGVKERVLAAFSRIVDRMGLRDQFDTRNVLLIHDQFSDEALNRAAFAVLERHKEELVGRFATDDVRDIAGMSRVLVVFFTDEKAKAGALANGAADRIRAACRDAMACYDEFDYLSDEEFTVVFDSKENLDQNYQGSLFYYFR